MIVALHFGVGYAVSSLMLGLVVDSDLYNVFVVHMRQNFCSLGAA